MKYILLILLHCIALTTKAQSRPVPKYHIGDTLSCGAIVFDVLNTDSSFLQKVLICAPSDIAAGQVPWYNGQYLLTYAMADGEFDRANAQRIVNVQGNTGNYAALLCSNFFTLTNCPDTTTAWYLPSKKELSVIYANLSLKNMGHFANEGYWSSIEDSLLLPVTGALDSQPPMTAKRAWIVDFYDGNAFPVDKANKYHVRPVRYFIASYVYK
jgi:hypothetical protein